MCILKMPICKDCEKQFTAPKTTTRALKPSRCKKCYKKFIERCEINHFIKVMNEQHKTDVTLV